MIKHHRLLRHNRFLLILSAFLLFSGAPKASPADAPQPSNWTVLFHDDFEDGNAEGWAVSLQDDQARGWQVEMDGNNTVFAGRGFSTATLTPGRWYDYRFAARVKFIQSGIVLSFRQGLFSGYMVSFQADQMSLSRAVGNGMPSLVANAPGPFSADRWYSLEIVGIGANIKVYVDGVVKIDYTDPDPILFGGVSLSCPSGAYVLADDVELSGPPSPAGPLWIKTGGPLGGVGYDVRMRPDNLDQLYVTDTFSGVHMSADGGSTWIASNKGMTSRVGLSGDAIPVFCLTIDPHNHDIVWIGTQGTRTIFKSVDGGKTWVQKNNGIVEPANTTFRGFTIDPRTSDIVYAAAEGPPLATGKMSTLAAGVVYRTTDGGENWNVVWRGDSLARYIWINPQNPDVIYVSTGIFDREATNSNAAQNFAGGVGILKSVDGGLTWRALNQNNGLQNLYISSLFMHPQNPDILLAAAGNLGYWEGSGAYLSTDGGEHWQKTLSPSTLGLVELDPVTSVEFSVADPRIAYAGSQTTFWRSADGGYTWTVMSGGTTEGGQLWYGPPGTAIGKPIDLQVDPRNPDRVFVNNYGGGNFLTEDGGKTWTNASAGYTGAEVWMVAVDSANPSRVFANAKSGPFRSDDGGVNWKGMQFYPMGLDVQGGLALDPTNADRVLLGEMRSGKIFRSTDGGQSWDLRFNETKVNPSDCGVDNCNGFRVFAFAPSNPNVVYAGMRRQILSIDAGNPGTSFGVYKSLDRGETWQPANDTHSAEQDINALVVDPRSADIAYAGTIAAGVLRTQDGGESWAAVNLGLPLLDVRSLAIDPANPSVLYAGLERGALYKTADGGDHWFASGYGMDAQASVRALAIDPTNPNVLYAGDALTGCYRSQDAGQTWEQTNDGLRMRAVMALAISSDGGTLYAATAGEGVFRLNTNLFSDIPSSYWAYNYIIAIYNNGITTGCVQDDPDTPENERKYCPEESVTRGQMAAFIIRAKYGETFSYTTTPYFTDVPLTHTFFKYVQKLKDDGITTVSGTYAVDNEVTRGQMAAFIIRAKFGETFSYTTTPYFSDVPTTHTFFKYVQKLKEEGITTLTGSYGVDDIVTRAQMAAFFARAFLGME